MNQPLSYKYFLQFYKLTHDDVLNHIVEVYFPTNTIKQKTLAKHNLTLIFDATAKLSKSMGYNKVTVRELQKETGLSMGSLYKYFTAKSVLESMLLEAIEYISDYSNRLLNKDRQSGKLNLELAVKGHLYVSQYFDQWYKLVFKEAGSFLPENIERLQNIQKNYFKDFSHYMNGSHILASDISLLVHDYYLRGWKYQNVSVDQFAEHCFKMAKIIKEKSDYLDDLVIKFA
ncbi:TetR/AcrR family transcriptional regulator [Oceaniserpentilla sp. 4NH20-0058]|uniref:TetR/AcrR family transcriptional regulator n=1 Tax=Oceaniserpentilla sp. 4NH20-0058 TaxID=3127660 RepID=UPI00333F0E6A